MRRKSNYFRRLYIVGLLFALFLWGCGHTGTRNRDVKTGAMASRSAGSGDGRHHRQSDAPSLHLVLGQDRAGRPARMLRATWPSRAGRTVRDTWGRTWTVDASGMVVVPEKLSLGYMKPPSADSYPFDGALASEFLIRGMESKAAMLLLSMLEVRAPQYGTVRDFFCSLWAGWRRRGATWEALRSAVVGTFHASDRGVTVHNIYHSFSFKIPGPWLMGAGRVPVSRGEASLVWLAPVSGGFNVLVVAVTEQDRICEALRVPEDRCHPESGAMAFSEKRTGRVSLKKVGDVTVAVVVVGSGPAPESISSTVYRDVMGMPCQAGN